MGRRNVRNTDIDGLDRLSRAELRELWAEELGGEPPASIGKGTLALGVAFTRQERCHGGVSSRLARELDRLLDRTSHGLTNCTSASTPVLRSGTILVREWQGTTHHVTAIDDGFVWNGKTHRSLSSIARAITGTKWNGPRFFGLRGSGASTPALRHGA